MVTTIITSFQQIGSQKPLAIQVHAHHKFLLWIVIPRILARCAGSNYHFKGSCSFEWLIKNLNTSNAIFSKCEYGLVYNLNNLAFASLTTSTNSTMKPLDTIQTWSKYAPPPIWAKVRASQELIQIHQTKLGCFEPLALH